MEHKDFSHPRSLRDYLRLFFTGFAMGAADIVPGVSGGTMAFILGVYETLINAIKSFDIRAARLVLRGRIREAIQHIPFGFLAVLGFGILLAIFSLSRVLSELLHTHPLFVFALFGGMIIASVAAIGVKVKWSAGAVIGVVGGAVVAFVVVGLPTFDSVSHDPVTLLLSGMLAIMAMILPGISGSFILLILGQYQFVLHAVKEFDLVSIGAVGVGAVIGITGFSRVLSWLLSRYENVTVAVLVGLMLGSLRKIWEEMALGAEKMDSLGLAEIGLAVALVLAGFVGVSFLDHLQSKENPIFRRLWRTGETVSMEP